MKKLFLICGLIGSGKTTYAKNNFSLYTDLDDMHDYATKEQQIKWTKDLLSRSGVVAHITTYPSDIELEMTKMYDTIFVLIDSSINQCKTNILIRSRPRDMTNLTNVFNANKEYQAKIDASELDWKRINIFL